jgi:hypothetical protein
MVATTIRPGGVVAAAAAADVIDVRVIVELVDEMKRECDRCCEEELRHQQLALQAVTRRRFQEDKLRRAVAFINDPASLQRERARQAYDQALCDAMDGVIPWRKDEPATDGEIGKWLRQWCERKGGDEGWCLYDGAPAIFLPGYDRDYPTVKGAELVAAVRRVLMIPVKAAPVDGAAPVLAKVAATVKRASELPKPPKKRVRDRRKGKTKPVVKGTAKVTPPLIPVCTNYGAKDAPWTREDLSHALSVDQLKTGLVKRVFEHDGKPYGVYAWEWPDGPEPQKFTLIELFAEADWQGDEPETFDERRIRRRKVDKKDLAGSAACASPGRTARGT